MVVRAMVRCSLPFRVSEVTLVATGAPRAAGRASVSVAGTASVGAAAACGWQRARVARVGGLRLREASEAQIREAARVEVQHPVPPGLASRGVERAEPEAVTLMVGGDGQLARRLGLDWVASLPALATRLEEEGSLPAANNIRSLRADRGMQAFWRTHAGAERALNELQFILSALRLRRDGGGVADERAIATGPEDGVAGLSQAPLWGWCGAPGRTPGSTAATAGPGCASRRRRLCWRSFCDDSGG